MKNIEASVSAVLTAKKKEAEKRTAEEEGEKYIRREASFFHPLKEMKRKK